MNIRVGIVFISLIVLYSLVAIKAFYIQVINRDKLISYSKSQLMRETKSYPGRGYILDRNGSPLAINVQRYNIFTFGKDIEVFKSELDQAAKIIGINKETILSQVQSRKKFTWIARKVKLSDKDLDSFKSFTEIVFEAQPSRFYPNRELLSQTLGFVGIDNEGLGGVEYFFNDQLKGEAIIHKYFKDAKGRPVKYKSSVIEHKAQDITLSIDKDIQADLEEYLKEAVVGYNANMGGAAVMDVDTGEIWAMANYPSFDPNNYKKYHPQNLKLSIASDPFEPGSIFKTLTLASAFENKTITKDTNYFCENGRLKIGKHIVKESDHSHKFEWLSVEDILKLSSNIGTTKIAFDLTYPLLKKSLNDFGIGEKTNIEIPGESRGILDDDLNLSPIRLSNISFGQGVATTGLQMLRVYATFANGGYLVNPTILKRDVAEEFPRVISESTAKTLTEILEKAVSEGTGSNARINHFKVAGKTSTAQRPDSKGGYSGYISGFIGYPTNVSKRFVVFVYIDNPKGEYYGNKVAAPVFNKIVKNIIYKRKEYNKLAIHLDESKKDFVNIKNTASRQISPGIVPNFIGLDKLSANKILESMKIKYKMTGHGVVSEQSLISGQKFNPTDVLLLKFSPPQYE